MNVAPLSQLLIIDYQHGFLAAARALGISIVLLVSAASIIACPVRCCACFWLLARFLEALARH